MGPSNSSSVWCIAGGIRQELVSLRGILKRCEMQTISTCLDLSGWLGNLVLLITNFRVRIFSQKILLMIKSFGRLCLALNSRNSFSFRQIDHERPMRHRTRVCFSWIMSKLVICIKAFRFGLRFFREIKITTITDALFQLASEETTNFCILKLAVENF